MYIVTDFATRPMYILFGDDAYEWDATDIVTWPELRAEVARKHRANQRLGVVLFYRGSAAQVGLPPPYTSIHFLLYNPGRKTISEQIAVTDYSWYLHAILSAIDLQDRQLSSVECHDWT